ncbi:MAG: cation:proton antiporter [Planctomycetota bacterium]
MDAWGALADLLALLVGGFLLGAVAERLRQSAILGYLLAGMLLGPHGIHLVSQTENVALLAELGVALLLFSIGLEFSWSRLKRTGGSALAGGGLQITLTILIALLVALLAGLDLRVAFVLGAVLALSSTAYVLRILAVRAQLDSEQGRLSIGVLLVQDLAVVPLVILVSVLRGGDGTGAALSALALLVGSAVLMVVGFVVLFHFLVPRLLGTEVLRRNRELPLLLATVSGLGAAMAAHALGLSPAIGTFLAGMLLAEAPFATQVRADVSALRTLLMMLFFGSIGMFGNPAAIASNLGTVVLVVGGVLVVKSGIVFFALRAFGNPPRASLAAGFCLAQIGEFSFVLAGMAHGTLLDDRLFQVVVSVTIVTLFATPYLMKAAPALADRLLSFFRSAPAQDSAAAGDDAPQGHVLVVGFGPTGQAVAASLHARGDQVHVLDLNPRSIEEAWRLGYHAHHGDGCHPDVLEHLAVARAVAIAVTVPSPDAARRITEQVRALAPSARVFVRSRYHIYSRMLQQAGAHVVVDEEEQMGRVLAKEVTEALARLG